MDNLHFSSLSIRQEPADFEKTQQWGSLLDLTYAVWRVCDMAIDNEFLKTRIKQNAADILSLYASAQSRQMQIQQISDQVNAQIALLSLAQRVSSAKEINFVILKNEYKKFNTVLSYDTAVSREDEKRFEPPAEKKASPAFERERDEAKEQSVPRQAVAVKKSTKETVQETALNDRQVKIVQFFNKSKEPKIKLKDIAQFFPNLTDRTIRNDLKDLCNRRMIGRSEGFGQASYYFLVKR